MNINDDKRTYYWANGERIPLEREPRVYAVKFRRGQKSDSAALSRAARRFLTEESEHRSFIPTYGLQIYQAQDRIERRLPDATPATETILEDLEALNREETIEYVTPSYRRSPNHPDLMFATNHFLVQFHPEVSREEIDQVNATHGVRIIEPLKYAENGYLLQAPSGADAMSAVELANIYYESGLARFANPDFVVRRHFRCREEEEASVATALPRIEMGARSVYLNEQWHLRIAKVVEAWSITRGNPSIKVAVLDDGVDLAHPEFAGRVNGQYDFATHVANGNPKTSWDNHGTSCAGVATARGAKAFGAAPECSLMAVRTPDYLGVADEAEMFRWTADQGADIISCSWGPQDGTGAWDPLPDNVRVAIRYCVTQGRSGRGIPIFWAAGNGNESVSLDGYASNSDVIAVAASTNEDRRAWYSDFGPEIWICAPSNGGSRGIFTADRLGAAGYNPEGGPANDLDYFMDFGGTSSSTPLAAGIAGLMLSVDPTLTVDQVRNILKETADQIGNDADYDSNGHSHLYGYGRVNALHALQETQRIANQSSSISQPSIQAQAASYASSGTPPSFDVNSGGRHLYAVEVATRAKLFHSERHASERTDNTFFGSWARRLETSSPYTLPAEVWDRLKQAERLYYRAHVADDEQWTRWAVTVPDAQSHTAPSVLITQATTGTTPDGTPSIQARAASYSPSGTPPSFDVNSGGRHLYAVEVATRAKLFHSERHASERTDNTFFGSWARRLETSSPYTLPAEVWDRLKQAERLYYRAHVADDEQWTHWAVTVPDAQSHTAPFISIIPVGSDGASGTDTRQTVRYPSGAVFEVVHFPQDGVDYSDSVGGGVVPLIEVAGRGEELLARDFRVGEFAARDGARYARIAPELVAGLQRMRDRLGAAIMINSAYRHRAYNSAVDGTERSQHIAGRAADIRSSAATPLSLARIALEELGCEIGIGLGRNILHVDLRGTRISWIYEGAAMNQAAFATWVGDACVEVHGGRIARLEVSERRTVWIDGPDTYNWTAEASTFLVYPGVNRYYAVEIATDWRLFNQAMYGGLRTRENFYASWHEGMHEAGDRVTTTYTLPDEPWQLLQGADRLFYRVVTSASDVNWMNFETSTPDDEAAEAPSMDLSEGRRTGRIKTRMEVLTPRVQREQDMARWSGKRMLR